MKNLLLIFLLSVFAFADDQAGSIGGGGGGGGPDTTSIARDGSRPPSANQPWSGFKITGYGTPTAADDVTDKGYVDTGISTHSALTTGVHGVTGDVVGTTDTQSLSAKTIPVATNTISSTANRACQFNGSGALSPSTTTLAQLEFLNTTTSDVQTQINSKPASTAVMLLDGSQAMAANIPFDGFDADNVGQVEVDDFPSANSNAVRLRIRPTNLGKIQTTDATATNIELLSSFGPDSQLAYYEVVVFARQTSDANYRIWKKTAKFFKPAASNPIQIGSTQTINEDGTAGSAAWAVTLGASGADVRIQVTGAAATTIDWHAVVNFYVMDA